MSNTTTNSARLSSFRRCVAALALGVLVVLIVSGVASGQNETPDFPGADVDCDATRAANDALLITEFQVGLRDGAAACPLAEPGGQLNAGAGDVNTDGTTDILDALLIAQCIAGSDNESCAPLPTPAPTPTPTPNPLTGTAPGFIIAVESGMCVEAIDSSVEAGATIGFDTCGTPRPHERWLAVEVAPSVYEFQNEGSSMCLSVDGDDAGALVVQWPCDAQPAQRFTIVGSALRVEHSGQCLDGSNDSTAEGAVAVQQPCDDSASQNFLLETGTVPRDARARDGFWGPAISTPLVPVAGANLPDGRVLLWSAFAPGSFGGDRGFTQTAIFDPSTTLSASRQISNTGHDMFCPGIANLSDGRILVNGGSSASKTSIYDPVTDQWVSGGDMNVTRGYNSTALLSNGDVFTLGGSWSGGLGGKHGEVWSSDNTWRSLPQVPSESIETNDIEADKADNHAWLFAWENGRVFHAGPSSTMHWIDTEGAGTITPAGTRANDPHAMSGNAVMYEPGLILTLGGAPNQSSGFPTGNAHIVDITGPGPVTRAVESMAAPRIFQSSVVLPTGEVVIVGGQSAVRKFTDEQSVLAAEIFDPETERLRSVAAMTVPRNYHSIAMLLTDGRVLAGGGGLCGGCNANHFDVQIFTPPYLFGPDGELADRPVVTSAPGSVGYGETVAVSTDRDVEAFSLVRMASVTHAVNNDQRRIPVSSSGGDGTYVIEAPTSAGVAPPGLYMLFAMDSNGVPSVASLVQLS